MSRKTKLVIIESVIQILISVLIIAATEAEQLAAKTAAKEATEQTITKAAISREEATINKLAAKYGKKPESIKKMIDNAALKKEIGSSGSWLTKEKLLKFGTGAAVTLASTDALLLWYGLDNVIGGQKLYARDLLGAVNSGNINPVDAEKTLNETNQTRTTAINFIDASTKYNPMLWPFRNYILSGLNADNTEIDLYTQQIKQASAAYQAQGGMSVEEELNSGTDWNKISEQRKIDSEQNRIENEESQKRIIEAWQKAKDENREADAAYWEEQLKEKQRQQEENEAYWAEVDRKQKENAKSKLNFGIL